MVALSLSSGPCEASTTVNAQSLARWVPLDRNAMSQRTLAARADGAGLPFAAASQMRSCARAQRMRSRTSNPSNAPAATAHALVGPTHLRGPWNQARPRNAAAANTSVAGLATAMAISQAEGQTFCAGQGASMRSGEIRRAATRTSFSAEIASVGTLRQFVRPAVHRQDRQPVARPPGRLHRRLRRAGSGPDRCRRVLASGRRGPVPCRHCQDHHGAAHR